MMIKNFEILIFFYSGVEFCSSRIWALRWSALREACLAQSLLS